MQFIFRIPSRFMTVFLDLILVSQFTMRYYLENPSFKLKNTSKCKCGGIFLNLKKLFYKQHSFDVIQKDANKTSTNDLF